MISFPKINTKRGLQARMIAADREYVMSKYKLSKLKDIEELIADAVQVNIRKLVIHVPLRPY